MRCRWAVHIGAFAVITDGGKGTAAAVHAHVDTALHSRVYATGAPAVVLTDIRTWPGNASLALHALCDTDNAPRLRLVVLMPGRRVLRAHAARLQ